MIFQNLEPYTPRYIGLVIETNSKEPFMPEEPINVMKSGNFSQVPFLTGYTSLEGATLDLVVKSEVLDFEKLIPWSLGYKIGSPESKAVAAKLKKFYFGDEEYSRNFLKQKYDVSITHEFIRKSIFFCRLCLIFTSFMVFMIQ